MSLYIRFQPSILGGGGGGGTLVVGTIDSNTPSLDGASIVGSQLFMQSASTSDPGLVNLTTQSFQGQKTFATGLTGTLTGHATLDVATSTLGNLTDVGTDGIIVTGGSGAVIGSVSLAQHVADVSHNGYLSSTDWSRFNTATTNVNVTQKSDNTDYYLTFINNNTTGSYTLDVGTNLSFNPGTNQLIIGTGGTVVANVITGNIQMEGAGIITIQAISGGVVNYNFNLPENAGTTGYFLSSGGGIGGAPMTWTDPASLPQGTVTAVSIVSANGFAGSSSGGATPALTISTSITGILQGNGTAISAASTTGSGAVVLATSPTLVTPALGTPSALIGTNITGTAAGLTAGNVTTNANLTGVITSSGNATSIASQTGTGTKFVVDNSPTLITPNLGTPSTLVGTNISGTGASFTAGHATAPTSGSAHGVSVLDSSGNFTSVSPGSSGNILTSNGTDFISSAPALNSPLTTKGDIWGYSSTNARVPVGADGYALFADSAQTLGVKYAPIGGLSVQPTIQKFISGSGTYTPPAGVQYIRVEIVGAGGGGGASGNSGGGQSNGLGGSGDTFFGTSLLVAGPGAGGAANVGAAGVGGSASLGSGPIGVAIAGSSGTPSSNTTSGTAFGFPGGAGGTSPLGGSGGGGNPSSGNGVTAAPNSGSGGGGGAINGLGSGNAGAGGGAGGYVNALILSPTSQTYSIATGGAGGSAGSGGSIGGNGGDGIIIVTEYYYNLSTSSTLSLVNPTIQKFLSGSGTYTTPAGVQYIQVEMVGGGAGGNSGGTSSTGNPGGSAGDTTFGTSFLKAGGASGGASYIGSGPGGTVSLGSGPIGIALVGATGGASPVTQINSELLSGGIGASTPFGGSGGGGSQYFNSGVGLSASSNTGAGGGGGGLNGANTGASFCGAGGSAGGYVKAIVSGSSLASTFSYSVGAGGIGGVAGTDGYAGGDGGNGLIVVTEYYTSVAIGTSVDIPANTFIAGPASGSATTPVARMLVGADLTGLIPIITNWIAYTPTFQGLGTVTSINVASRRVGSNLEVKGSFTLGTTTGIQAYMTLGYNGTSANVNIESTIFTQEQVVGDTFFSASGFTGQIVPLMNAGITGQTYIQFGIQNLGNGGVPVNGTSLTSSSVLGINISVPIAGWTATT